MISDEFQKPEILISRCLGFASCRWNSDIINNEWVERLKPFVNFYHVCPEVDCGLGVPRAPLRLIRKDNLILLFQPASGRFFNQEFENYVNYFFNDNFSFDGGIFCARSPSCGLMGVKLYNHEKNIVVAKTEGLFISLLKKKGAQFPLIDHGRINDENLRDKFFTAIFLFARLKYLEKNLDAERIIAFHSANKLLFMARNQTELRKAGKLLANLKTASLPAIFAEYRRLVLKIIFSQPRKTANINVLEHIAGYFKNELSAAEKRYFQMLLDGYRKGNVSLQSLKILLASWVERYQSGYLQNQTYFQPYPRQLIEESVSL